MLFRSVALLRSVGDEVLEVEFHPLRALEKRGQRRGAPPVGSAPSGFWAELECAFLNSYQARMQYAVDMLGHGFAQIEAGPVELDLVKIGGIEFDASTKTLIALAGL